MATTVLNFRQAATRIHAEHEELLDSIGRFEEALEHLEGESGVSTNNMALRRARHFGQILAEHVPDHCSREEKTLFEHVRNVSPELQILVEELRRQHSSLKVSLEKFSSDIAALERTRETAPVLRRLRMDGIALVQMLRGHVALEEHELSGFL